MLLSTEQNYNISLEEFMRHYGNKLIKRGSMIKLLHTMKINICIGNLFE
jgi:hypothetical protein